MRELCIADHERVRWPTEASLRVSSGTLLAQREHRTPLRPSMNASASRLTDRQCGISNSSSPWNCQGFHMAVLKKRTGIFWPSFKLVSMPDRALFICWKLSKPKHLISPRVCLSEPCAFDRLLAALFSLVWVRLNASFLFQIQATISIKPQEHNMPLWSELSTRRMAACLRGI